MVISCQFSSQDKNFPPVFPKTFLEHYLILVSTDPPCVTFSSSFNVTHCSNCSSYQKPITSVCSSGRKCLNLGFPRQNRTINVFRLSCQPHNKMALFFHLSWSGNFTASWMNFLFGQNFQLCFKFCLSGGKRGLF